MGLRIRQHVNPLHAHFETFRGHKPTFQPGRRVEVEIGCADAQFLFERAALDPSRTYVGLEIREDLVNLVNKRAAQQRVPVHAVFCQAQLHIDEIFGDTKVERVYLNFPDPWFKKRHRERRMIDDRLIAAIARVVKPGGDLFVQSDVWDVAIDAMAVIEQRDAWFTNLAPAGEWSFWRMGNPFGARSWRESNAAEEGLPVWRMLYRRTTAP